MWTWGFMRARSSATRSRRASRAGGGTPACTARRSMPSAISLRVGSSSTAARTAGERYQPAAGPAGSSDSAGTLLGPGAGCGPEAQPASASAARRRAFVAALLVLGVAAGLLALGGGRGLAALDLQAGVGVGAGGRHALEGLGRGPRHLGALLLGGAGDVAVLVGEDDLPEATRHVEVTLHGRRPASGQLVLALRIGLVHAVHVQAPGVAELGRQAHARGIEAVGVGQGDGQLDRPALVLVAVLVQGAVDADAGLGLRVPAVALALGSHAVLPLAARRQV